MNHEQERSHAGEENLAAGVRTVVIGNAAVHIDDGSHFVLVEVDETAAAGIVALAGFVEIAHTVALTGLVELADTAVSVDLAVVADVAVLDVVGSADTAAQGSLVVGFADIVA